MFDVRLLLVTSLVILYSALMSPMFAAVCAADASASMRFRLSCITLRFTILFLPYKGLLAQLDDQLILRRWCLYVSALLDVCSDVIWHPRLVFMSWFDDILVTNGAVHCFNSNPYLGERNWLRHVAWWTIFLMKFVRNVGHCIVVIRKTNVCAPLVAYVL